MNGSTMPHPANEQQRLEALKEYEVLDTLPEKQFDDITRLASIICDTPVTLISLIDKDRQWFKSKQGLDAEQTSREISFCRYAILGDEVFEVPDPLEDERFAQNPLVQGEPNIRFYAGAPLRTPGGYNVGTLCVIDTKPRKLSADQKEALRILAAEVVTNLELRRERNRLKAEKQEVDKANDLLHAFFENGPSQISMKDRNGKYIYANGNMLAQLGKTAGDVIGHSDEEFFPYAVAGLISGAEKEVLETGKLIRREYSSGDDAAMFVSYIFPLLDVKQEAYGTGTITNDITQARRTERDLQKSNERFLNIFRDSPVGMVITSLGDRRYVNVNSTFLSIFGFSSEAEVIGKTSQELRLVAADERERILALLEKYGSYAHEEIRCLTKTGRNITLLGSVNRIEMSGETLFLSSFIDITERKELEKAILVSNNRFTSLFYHSPIGITISDAETSEFTLVNNAFLETFGYTREEVIGKKAGELKIIPDQPVHDAAAETGRIKSREIRATRKNGDAIYCLFSTEFIDVEGRRQAVSAFQDITLRRETELQLAEAKREAEQATLSKSLFLANMSHEIRTPLNAMLGFADLLERTPLTAQQKDYLEAIDTSGKNLLTIINDILDFSKIEAGMLSIEKIPFSLQQALHSVYTMFSVKAQSKQLKLQITIDPALPPLVMGDPTRLNQVMINLIGNAVKFTAEGSVVVEAAQLAQHGNKVKLRISVKDTGIGIAKEKIDRIFDRFTQAENDTTRNFGGTGLGLSIAARLVELQDGRLEVNSTPGKGSEFFFTIEYGIADQKAYTPVEKTEQEVTGLFRGKRVLVVEDNALNQKLALTLLQFEGFEVKVADNGRKAVDLLQQERFDIILMDIQMPVLDGYEATKKIRCELGLTTPIIAMTANALAGEQERCIESGMNDYITKPFNPGSLMRMISRLLPEEPQAAAAAKSTEAGYSDMAHMLEFSGGKLSIIKGFIEIFLEQLPRELNRLDKALAANNFEEIRQTTHSMQSSLGFIGFPPALMDNLRASEQMADARLDMELIREKLKGVVAGAIAAQDELRNTLHTL